MRPNYSQPFCPLHKILRLLIGVFLLLAVHVALLNNLLNYNKPTEAEPGQANGSRPRYEPFNMRESLQTALDRQTEPTNTQTRHSSVNLSTPNVDYGQGRWLEIEGLDDYFMWHENYFEPQPGNMMLRRLQKCRQAVKNVFFLKTHCTGGDIIGNILHRFADLRNLLLAIPNNGLSTFHWPNRFNWKFIDLMLLDGQLPNIYTSHTRFSSDVVNRILPPDAAFLTILRNPVNNFIVTFEHFEYARILGLENYTDPLLTFLENPKWFIQKVIKERRFTEKMNLIINGMFFDLGLKTDNYHRAAAVRDAISDIEDEFSLVLIYEYLDESLVLLKRKLCWELDDILYIKPFNDNVQTREVNIAKLKKIRKWSSADVSLYQYFNKSLWNQIAEQGEDFQHELDYFKMKNKQLNKDCTGYNQDSVQELHVIALSANVSAINKYLCEKLLFSELDYLQYFRNKMKRTFQGKVTKHRIKSDSRFVVGFNSSLIAGSAKDGKE